MARPLIIISLFLLCSSSAQALSWSEAVSMVQDNNQIQSSKSDLESSEGNYRKSYTGFFPQLNASASYRETESSTQGAYSLGLSATQYLFRGMEGIYGVQSAYASLEYKKANYLATQASVIYELRAAFIDLLIAQENVELLEKILEQRKENTRLVNLRYESGREDKGNLLTTQAEEAQARQSLASAKRSLKLSKLKISQILNHEIESAEEEIILGKIEEAPLTDRVNASPLKQQAEKQLEIAELSYKSTISGFLPTVSLSANYSKQGDTWLPEDENKSWSLNVSYSLFPGGSNFIERSIGASNLEKAKQDYAAEIKDIQYSIEQAFYNFNDAIESVEVSEISLQANKERAKITRAKYLNGLAIYDEWSRIENSFIQAQTSLLNAQKSALLAEANWYKSYGGYKQ